MQTHIHNRGLLQPEFKQHLIFDFDSFVSVSSQAKFEQYYAIPKPTRCPGQLNGDVCDSKLFTPVDPPDRGPSLCKDYQEIKIQEQVQKLAVGTIPRSMWAVLEDDLVDTCKVLDLLFTFPTSIHASWQRQISHGIAGRRRLRFWGHFTAMATVEARGEMQHRSGHEGQSRSNQQ
jgi:hypothetical protein